MRAELLRLQQRRDKYFDRDKKKRKNERKKLRGAIFLEFTSNDEDEQESRERRSQLRDNVFVRYRRFLYDAVP